MYEYGLTCCIVFRLWYFTVLLFWFTMEEILGICDSDDKKVIDIKLEQCYDICNTTVSMKTEAIDSTSNTREHVILQTNINIKQPQKTIDEVQIKHGMDHDSDIEVDLAYRIIDTYNICEVHPFQIDTKTILPDTKPALSIGQPNNKQAQLKVEVDNKTDFLYEMTNVCSMEKIAFIKENVDYENLTVDDDVDKKPVPQLQKKGM